MHYCIIGTAGHIDHGKTALIKTLTGIETDRLKEEKERGISIDLGFAYMDLEKGKRCGIVDVPGHERFIKNMVAGAVGMDIVLLVVAATEGVMPQTIEHLDILRFLCIKKGIIVITKIDLATEDQVKNTEEEILDLVKGTFLEGAPIVLFSSVDGRGKEELKGILGKLYNDVEERDIKAPVILPVDRVFTISGFGTVVTGTLNKGTLNKGALLEVQPQNIEVRVRNIQVHNEFVERAYAGQRVAVNFIGADKEILKRGNWLLSKNVFSHNRFIDASFTLLPYPRDLKNHSRIRLHIGTNEIIGRINFLESPGIKSGETQLVQFDLEKPVIISNGEHYVVRSYSPSETIGGGRVLQGVNLRHKAGDKKIIEYLYKLQEGERDNRLEHEISYTPFQSYSKFKQKGQEEDVKKLILSNKAILIQDTLLHIKDLKNIEEELLKILKEFHRSNPLRIGPTSLEIVKLLTDKRYNNELKVKILREILDGMTDRIEVKKGRFKLKDFEIKFTQGQDKLKRDISLSFEKDLFKPPLIEDVKKEFGKYPDFKQVFSYLLEQDLLIPVQEGVMFYIKAIDKAKQIISEEIKREGKITAAKARDLFNTNRKYAIFLLEYFDRINFTRRIGDNRVLVSGE